jgi:hypothetical protein
LKKNKTNLNAESNAFKLFELKKKKKK